MLTKKKLEEYVEAGLSQREIGERVGVSDMTISRWMKKLGVLPTNESHKGTVKFNTSYFETIDSNEKAAALGLVASDGCIQSTAEGDRHDCVQLHLKLSDLPTIGWFRDQLQSNCKITITQPRFFNSNGREYFNSGSAVVSFYSSKLVEDLAKLGIGPRKSLTCPVPPVPEEYRAAYWFGVGAGDAHYGWHPNGIHLVPVIKLVGSQETCEGFSDWARSIGCTGAFSTRTKENIYQIATNKAHDVLKVAKAFLSLNLRIMHRKESILASFVAAQGHRIYCESCEHALEVREEIYRTNWLEIVK